VVYEGTARQLLARLKYGNARASVPWLARAMGDLVDPGLVDVVTWVPTTGARRRRRGYDQARLLARAVARQAGLPCRRLLRRRPGPAQTGQSREARWHRPAFDAERATATTPKAIASRVLVVDDIITTGATMAAAAAALKTAGAERVIGLAAAQTLLNSAPRVAPPSEAFLKPVRAPSDGLSDDSGGHLQPTSSARRRRRRPATEAPQRAPGPAVGAP
jgi:predicted amidophosphoribosyltransferase